MLEPPADVGDADVLEAVRRAWSADITAVEHLPVGFGAHHWAAHQDGRPALFVTLDRLGVRHSAASLESAYAAAAALAGSGLEFVLASLPTAAGRFTVPFADGALSATPWREGQAVGAGAEVDAALARPNAAMLARLHAAVPPPGIPGLAPTGPAGPPRATRRPTGRAVADRSVRRTGADRAGGPAVGAAPLDRPLLRAGG